MFAQLYCCDDDKKDTGNAKRLITNIYIQVTETRYK